MSEIEKIQEYIKKNPVHDTRFCYDASMKELLAMSCDLSAVEAVSVAFCYGKAKGYLCAKAEARKAAKA